MKFTIKEIKEKLENDDPAKFKATVDKVWEFKEKASKYYIGYQNIIVKDDTDKIKVIFSKIRKKEDIYKDDIEGKEVEVSGTVSFYTNPNSGEEEINIFGVLKFEEEQMKSPVGIKSGVTQRPEALLSVAGGITEEEIRLKCLTLAFAMHKGNNPKPTDIIGTAQKFEKYVFPKATVQVTKNKEEKPKEEKNKPKGTNGNGDTSPEHIKQINILMALAENRGKEGKEYINDLIVIKGYKSIKEFLDEDVEEATKELEKMGTSDIPF